MVAREDGASCPGDQRGGQCQREGEEGGGEGAGGLGEGHREAGTGGAPRGQLPSRRQSMDPTPLGGTEEGVPEREGAPALTSRARSSAPAATRLARTKAGMAGAGAGAGPGGGGGSRGPGRSGGTFARPRPLQPGAHGSWGRRRREGALCGAQGVPRAPRARSRAAAEVGPGLAGCVPRPALRPGESWFPFSRDCPAGPGRPGVAPRPHLPPAAPGGGRTRPPPAARTGSVASRAGERPDCGVTVPTLGADAY